MKRRRLVGIGVLVAALLGFALVRGRSNSSAASSAVEVALDLGPNVAQAGFDSSLELRAHASHPGTIHWRQVAGPRLGELVAFDRGSRVRLRMPSFADSGASAARPGLVPFSPRTRGQVELEAEWTNGRQTVQRTIRVAAAARATGLASVALGHRVFLAGDGWQIRDRPAPGVAELTPSGGVTSLLPDARGRWVLSDRAGRTLALRVGRFDETPLDCGRADCHVELAESSQRSAMTHVLERGLTARFGPGYDVGCAVECHAVGESGIDDGGFADVARELGVTLPPPGPSTWQLLPRALRRLGGVGCTGCHGPGAIPEPDTRPDTLRSDVCAVCHDAPPRYSHVVAWRSSRMSRSDRDPRTRSSPCADCHTTNGFLASVTGRRPDAPSSADGTIGIACAACHDPHALHSGARLVRSVALPAALSGAAITAKLGNSGICLPCHSPRSEEQTPSASEAAIWAGRGERLRLDAVPPAPHLDVGGGCIGCHRDPGPDPGSAHGLGHAFRVDVGVCGECHQGKAPRERPNAAGELVSQRAAKLWRRITEKMRISSNETHPGNPLAEARPGALALAGHDVLLVLLDPAAGAHNAPFARALLDAAERRLDSE